MAEAATADADPQFREAMLALSDCVCVSKLLRDDRGVRLRIAAWVTHGRIRPPGAGAASIGDIQVFNGVCVLRMREGRWLVEHGVGQLMPEKSFSSLDAALEFIKAEIEDYWRR